MIAGGPGLDKMGVRGYLAQCERSHLISRKVQRWSMERRNEAEEGEVDYVAAVSSQCFKVHAPVRQYFSGRLCQCAP